MKLFNLFNFKSKNASSTSTSKRNTIQEKKCQKIKFETKIAAKDIASSQEVIQSVINKMVREDPFKNFYTGKVDADFTPLSKRVYKYDAITTVNVDLIPQDGTYAVSIEGISLGSLPQSLSGNIADFYDDSMLTAYAYVTGGQYKEYSQAKETVVEQEEPGGIDIYIQFT